MRTACGEYRAGHVNVSRQPAAAPDHPVETLEQQGGAPTARVERVQSLERGLAVLRAFSAATPALTMSEVAQRTGLTRATARRILLTLEELGYVRADRRAFSLTPAVLQLAQPFTASGDPWEFAKPYLQALTDRTGESASIAVLDSVDILYVARVQTRRLLTLAITIGSRLPAHATSKGRVLLANLPEAELEAYLARAAFSRLTDHTVIEEAELRSILADVRHQGWAIVDQQLEVGLCSVAAPLVDANGRVSAALSVCAHAGRVEPAALRSEFLPLVLETARRISAAWIRR
jgi:IclR family transcriptional regulator, pca regulon regulatory protein